MCGASRHHRSTFGSADCNGLGEQMNIQSLKVSLFLGTCIVSVPAVAQDQVQTGGTGEPSTAPPDVSAETSPAQEVAPESNAASTTIKSGAPESTDIIVTARKRGERLIDVPIAISAVTSADLQARAVTSVNELGSSVPNVRLPANNGGTQTSGVYAYGMRGVVTNARNIGFEPGVGTYVDGVYVSRASAFNQVLSDVERVEVLRGPQGTLFGKNTIAGAINIITKEPSDHLTGSFSAGIGNRDGRRGDAWLSGPLADGVAAKISAYHSRKDGDVRNIFDGTRYLNGDNTSAIRSAVRFQPTDDFKVIIAGDYTRARTTGTGMELARLSGLALSVPEAVAGDRDEMNIDGRFGSPTFSRRNEWGVSATAQLDLADNQVTSITGYRDSVLHFASDDDATPWPIQYSDFEDGAKAFSQEIRLAGSTGGGFWTYLIGAYYFNQSAEADRFTRSATPDAFNPSPRFPIFVSKPTTSGLITSDSRVKSKSWAAFTSNDFKLAESLRLTVGLRYTEEKKSLDLTQRDTSWINFPDLDIQDQSRKDNDVSGNVSLSYHPTKTSTLYVSAARGFKSGGFNPDYVRTSVTFGPERVTSYEVGAKADLFDRALRFTGAAFYIDYDDQQVNSFVNAAFLIQNAGKSTIKGVEAELSIRPLDRLHVTGSVGYADATFESFPNCNGPNTSCAGNRLPYVSQWTGYASVDYEIPLSTGSITPRAEWSYTGDAFFDSQNNSYNHVDSYSLVNGTITYQRNDGWSVSLWAKNLLNHHYDAGRWDFAGLFGIYYRMPGETRTFGADVRYNF